MLFMFSLNLIFSNRFVHNEVSLIWIKKKRGEFMNDIIQEYINYEKHRVIHAE